MKTRSPLLSLRDLAVSRGGVPVLARVSFDLFAGEALVLHGPNGSGKTTLLRTIAGLAPALEGEIALDPDHVAYAGHADGLKATLSVHENLGFWAGVYGAGDQDERIDAALEAFNLKALHARLAGSLSAGQKRRLGLARLMVTGRALWVLDEPTVSLDAASVALFAAAVRGHLAQGGAALMATHIDLGIEARRFDVTPHRASTLHATSDFDSFDEAFQ